MSDSPSPPPKPPKPCRASGDISAAEKSEELPSAPADINPSSAASSAVDDLQYDVAAMEVSEKTLKDLDSILAADAEDESLRK
jgi:hypothetical protein